ncbi:MULTISPECIES: diacylglycerol kinase family protein [unclassified Streptomyces]|uniref:diacylglycerol/lipid kinase family protein n=1 Tax=unclassified Streptomyces TaxID=2593676 RepID=UPI0024740832|nr:MULTISPECIES: diacylglycerol kinase family protein [unclassified Streptomyces]MDH6447911.1 diacylglycerol kinase family enzyme [Streptomyces sp. SAI-119]MDH6501367.1 diacylglycerol kinase family enzyme [Streptomyces sp. SAI-149]
MSVDVNAPAFRRQRWAARTSLATAALAVLLPLAYGGLGGVLLLAAGLAGAAVTAAAMWWTLTRRGPERWLAAALAVVTPALVLVLFVITLGWVIVLSPVLWSVAVWSGRYALRSAGTRPKRMKEHRARSVRRPFLIMNPRSGGGKVEQFGLREKAERLGARVVLLDPEEQQDVTALARAAVAEGADLLGVAGGDGTQALVAAVAAEHDLPFLVVSAGTRNHFAMDLGLDRTDPATCLEALTDGVELRVDLGFVADHPFVNNASFGAYAAVVQSPAYRDDKIGTTLELLPDLLTRQRGPHLTARVDATTIDGPQAVLVSNNAYRTGDPVGLGRRERLDSGLLGILGVRVDSAAEAAALLLDPDPEGLAVLSAREVVVDADRPEIEVGVDGEALVLPTPVHCRIAPGALRVRVPRKRPGVPARQPRLNWRRLRKLAAPAGRG